MLIVTLEENASLHENSGRNRTHLVNYVVDIVHPQRLKRKVLPRHAGVSGSRRLLDRQDMNVLVLLFLLLLLDLLALEDRQIGVGVVVAASSSQYRTHCSL